MKKLELWGQIFDPFAIKAIQHKASDLNEYNSVEVLLDGGQVFTCRPDSWNNQQHLAEFISFKEEWKKASDIPHIVEIDGHTIALAKLRRIGPICFENTLRCIHFDTETITLRVKDLAKHMYDIKQLTTYWGLYLKAFGAKTVKLSSDLD